jgi:hypothetical protein
LAFFCALPKTGWEKARSYSEHTPGKARAGAFCRICRISPAQAGSSGPNEPPRPEGRGICKRYIIYEVRSVRKLFNCGVYYHFLLVLPILTAPRGGVLDPTATKCRGLGEGIRARQAL